MGKLNSILENALEAAGHAYKSNGGVLTDEVNKLISAAVEVFMKEIDKDTDPFFIEARWMYEKEATRYVKKAFNPHPKEKLKDKVPYSDEWYALKEKQQEAKQEKAKVQAATGLYNAKGEDAQVLAAEVLSVFEENPKINLQKPLKEAVGTGTVPTKEALLKKVYLLTHNKVTHDAAE